MRRSLPTRPDGHFVSCSQVMGQPQPDALWFFIKYYGLDTTPERLQPELAKIEHDLFTKVKPLPGALRLVKYLVDHKIPIALATGSTEDKVKLKTSHLPELIDCFPKDCRVTSCYPKLKPGRGKPHPDVFLLAGETIGRLTPEQRARTLTFEDGLPVRVYLLEVSFAAATHSEAYLSRTRADHTDPGRPCLKSCRNGSHLGARRGLESTLR